jgi:hypothetical protein
VVVFEFSRALWKRSRVLHPVAAMAGFHAEQAVWLRDGKIRKVETRELSENP